ncbi:MULTISPECIES: NAD(P)H-hydrate dehydratase [unclassified Curtobacterium]|uniref:NAD(P)H-hydrate dehydratase n=1 Tax=unclassified Curtobacterium TaxID=257496 RepID=UPI000DAA7512|nr:MULTISPECIES: NAD(P)H-hydrate dehydratase [unclassified Curtobacterium]PZE53484.1 NAD(P)H-hydrate dehydratase [Curtobacterium sp. MCLR17_044]WIB42349.1 NAD(P)H-hydrate dehydratase [Curtobacterium sp. MCLR17_058]
MSTEPVTPNFLRDWPLPEPGAGKYGRGQVLIVGGAARTPGAAMLSALAALRVGAGRLTLAVGRSVANEVAVVVPESGVEPLDEDQDGHIAVGAIEGIADSASSADAVLVGPGLDEPDGSRDLVAGLADVVGPQTTVVLDAFALGVAAEVRDRLEPLRGRLVMTPNSGEAERLLGRECSDDDVADAVAIANRFGAVVALGDAIATPQGRAWLKGTGSGGLGTSGSGDVLSGAVTGLLARGADPAQAVAWASYVHAAAGDRLAVQVGPLGYLASELVTEIPRVLVELGA